MSAGGNGVGEEKPAGRQHETNLPLPLEDFSDCIVKCPMNGGVGYQ